MPETHKLLYISSLSIPLILGGVAFVVIEDSIVRFLSALFLCVGYIIWGWCTHYFADKQQHSKVYLEYTLMGLLGLALTVFLI